MEESLFLLTTKELQNKSPEYLETIFSLGNGHLGVRASFPFYVQNKQFGNPGLFVNGFFCQRPIIYGERAYGYAKNHQTMAKLPSPRNIKIVIGGEDSSRGNWKFFNLESELNMSSGILNEKYDITTPQGKHFVLLLESFASQADFSIYAQKISILFKEDISEDIHVEWIFEKPQAHHSKNDDPRVARHNLEYQVEEKDDHYVISSSSSGKKIYINVSHTTGLKDSNYDFSYVFNIKKGFYKTKESNDYIKLKEAHKIAMCRFWESSDIEIDTDNPMLQKGLRFNLFHLFQAAGRDGLTNIPAKGLTGEGYEGHYFWDTEMYMLPFFIYTQPLIAKQLLRYRISILSAAKERAKELGYEGALFAWRTINGEETSAYYPAGTAQLHINGDIVYAFQLYENITSDSSFIEEEASEVIFETAKFWFDYGHFSTRDGHEVFCLDGVTGPDEYTALVNNNFYTNKIAQNNLIYASELARRLGKYSDIVEKWERASECMYFGYDETLKIHKQDDTFLQKEIWNFKETPKEKYPLLLHYHPMIIYKHQVNKQADLLLCEMLFSSHYSEEEIQRDYDYYERITTHDSSLSRSIFSIVGSRIGYYDKAYSYFMDTSLMDITDLQGNVSDGIHAANMGGSWLSIIYGFAGVEFVQNKGLIIRNNLPHEIKSLIFTLVFHGSIISIKLQNTSRPEVLKNTGNLPYTFIGDSALLIL